MKREDAKKAIAIYELQKLSNKDKREILENNYWFFDDKESIIESIKEGRYPAISDKLIETINNTPKPILTEESEILLIDYKVSGLKSVRNLYLQSKLKSIKPDFDEEVTGEEEKAGLCPCCEYYAIGYEEDGLWDICPVCFWENGGDGPNHMRLEDAKLNFLKFGAMNEGALKFIDKEAKEKYKKNEQI